MKRSDRQWNLFDMLNITFFVFCGLIMIFPLWNVLMTSLVSIQEFMSKPLIIWPEKVILANYRLIFLGGDLLNSLMVTIFVTLVGTLYSMLLTITLAYGLSKGFLPGCKFLTVVIILTMFFSGGLIPYYLLVRSLGLVNSIWVMILPQGVNAWNFLVLRAFFRQFPVNLEESAHMDGATPIRVLAKIVIPLSMPAIATIVLFYGVAYWNIWWDALLFITDNRLIPLQLLLRKMVVQNVRPEMMTQAFDPGTEGAILFENGIKMATVIIATVPIIIVYPFLQKYFTKGVMLGAVKG